VEQNLSWEEKNRSGSQEKLASKYQNRHWNTHHHSKVFLDARKEVQTAMTLCGFVNKQIKYNPA